MATIILGISPGTRIMGLGVIRNGDLKEWQVKSFKGSWSKEKLNLIVTTLEDLCDHFQVTEIALKVVSPLRSSQGLSEVTKGITDLAQNNGIELTRFTVEDLKLKARVHKGNGKQDLMDFVIENYPILKREYIKERNNLNPYYIRVFEAIAAAHFLSQEVES